MREDDFLTLAGNAINVLESISEYISCKLPCSSDDNLRQICSFYKALNQDMCEMFLSFLDEKKSSKLLTFAERMSMLSVREQSLEPLEDGLVGLLMAAYHMDWKEILMVLSLISNSATKLDVDPATLCEKVKDYTSNPKIVDLSISFINRPPEHRDITLMGYKEIEGPSGIIYWYGDRKPIPEGLL